MLSLTLLIGRNIAFQKSLADNLYASNTGWAMTQQRTKAIAHSNTRFHLTEGSKSAFKSLHMLAKDIPFAFQNILKCLVDSG